jgi:deoxyribodipyrimidine photo-lyase
MSEKISIFWFRQDLRIADNPGLLHAANAGEVLAIYIFDTTDNTTLGAASRWWLQHSLTNLNQQLNNKLNFYVGKPQEIITQLIARHNINAVFWNRCYEPSRVQDDTTLKQALKDLQIECKSFNGSLLWEPWTVVKSDGSPYKVFTPFYKNGCLASIPPRSPLPKPSHLTLIKDLHNSQTLETFNLLSGRQWYKKLEPLWQIGEQAANLKLKNFLSTGINNYKEGRNYPAQDNTSKLSPHIHFGEISPHQIWHASNSAATGASSADVSNFLTEIGWREFSYHLLYRFPQLPHKNYQAKFDNFQWQHNPKLLQAWQTGQTGYPIVDAGMRELWQTGYMHNRVRMIVASFLVKNLLIHWHHGSKWFWDCLVDADLANNSSSWQWVAGCGVDAAPYFRIFNPITQGEKFDASGEYTRKYIPELKALPNKYLFKPWEAPANMLQDCKIILGTTYPLPIVNLAQSRKQALELYHALKTQQDETSY